MQISRSGLRLRVLQSFNIPPLAYKDPSHEINKFRPFSPAALRPEKRSNALSDKHLAHSWSFNTYIRGPSSSLHGFCSASQSINQSINQTIPVNPLTRFIIKGPKYALAPLTLGMWTNERISICCGSFSKMCSSYVRTQAQVSSLD